MTMTTIPTTTSAPTSHLVVFTFGKNSKTGEPQWQARSKNGKAMYVPNKDGVQPSAEHDGWRVEEAFVAFTDQKNGFRIVIVNLLEEIPNSAPTTTQVRTLSNHSIDAPQPEPKR